MTEQLTQLAERIFSELVELDLVVERIRSAWERARKSSDDLYLDSVALNLHGFYAGLERMFELVAVTVDGTVPRGPHGHQVLLQQMVSEVPGRRPAVISDETRQALDDYRGFRHVVRHVYTLRLSQLRLQALVEKSSPVWSKIRAELQAFARFLQQQA